jgi:transposase-like protein
LLQKRRDKASAKRFFKRVLAVCSEAPSKIVIDQLRSYPAAKAEIPELASVIDEHMFSKASARVNNPAETATSPHANGCIRGFWLGRMRTLSGSWLLVEHPEQGPLPAGLEQISFKLLF